MHALKITLIICIKKICLQMPLGLIFCHLMQTVKHFNRSLPTLPCHTRKTTIQKYGVSIIIHCNFFIF